MEEFNNYSEVSSVDTSKTLIQTFFWMFLGLVSTALVAVVTYNSDAFIDIISMWPLLAIIEVVLVLVFHGTLRKASASVVTAIFFIYSMVNGLTFSAIFAVYDLGTIAYAFFATAALFGGLALVGYKTQRDISNIGTILFVGLIVGLVLSIFNIFIGSDGLSIMLDWLILAIFCGYTAYDINKLKQMATSGEYPEEKVAIYCALELYLDFINLFIRILRILSRARE